MRIAIIGSGAMGRWFAGFAKRNKWDVVMTDINVAKATQTGKEIEVEVAEANEEAVADADIALVAVPIAETPGVVREVAKHMQKGSLLMDIASAKGDVADEMEGLETNFELVSLHPLFGPGARDVKDRTFVAVPVKPGKRYTGFKRELEKLGAKVVEMEADDHDRLMAITQCMTHFVLMAYLSALRKMKKNVKRAEKLQTPMSSTLFSLAKAFLATNPDVMGELQVGNKYASIARSGMLEACRSLDVALEARDIRVLQKVFEDARNLLGPTEARAAYEELYEEKEGEKA
ncbi:MAG: prephenate dehydrogenase/arogenate dehydrogenase family protein [Candidatus Hadarchaeota archaeon]|nr:prephenate dehydrogenase/arogenate dehydrogenase family protein [Candidatus Hadarchaeota archaeon]